MRITIDTKGPLLPRRYMARLLPLALILWPTGNAVADYLITGVTPRTETTAASSPVYLDPGDEVAGYEVTSGYDLARTHPVDGTVQPHYGVDVATPTGTELIAPASLKVACWWDKNGGGLVAEVSDPAAAESVYKLLHLHYCTPGNYTQGETFALTGATGKGTGEHLDLRRTDKSEPSKQDIEPFLTGVPAKPTLTDTELACAIGAAEGTRDRNCETNQHYAGHTDPGNGAANIGTFSYQHGADSPEEADRLQLERLRGAEEQIQAQAAAKWNKPLSRPALAAALDLWNQAPLAATDFVEHLPNPNPTEAQIITARAESYVNPATGELDAPGLGNTAAQVEADQARRTGEVMDSIQRRRLEQLDN